MSKTRIPMTSLDASLFDSDAENDVASAFEADAEPAAGGERTAGADARTDRVAYSTALRTLLVSTTCHKP